jgi:hypothetical protein
LVIADFEAAHQAVVDDHATARCQSAHCELLPLRDAELANQEHVQGSVQGVGDLPADRNATTRQPEHKQIVGFTVGRQLLRQDIAGLPAVPEHTTRTPTGQSAQAAHRIDSFEKFSLRP